MKHVSPHSYRKHVIRWVELVVCFGFLPLLLFHFRSHIHQTLLMLIVFVALLCVGMLLNDKTFKRFRLWNKPGFTRWILPVLGMFATLIVLSTVLVYVYDPKILFYMPKFQFSTWLVLLLVYPLLSAFPQEIIFRTFLFHRYKTIIPRKEHRIWLSSICFGYVHIFYDNWLAVVLSTVAGYVFCKTYAHSRSTILVAIEHSLWGLWIFTLGIGEYFDSALIQ